MQMLQDSKMVRPSIVSTGNLFHLNYIYSVCKHLKLGNKVKIKLWNRFSALLTIK